MKALCVNCGRNETEKTICDQCRATFPGDPVELEEMVKTFKMMGKMMPAVLRSFTNRNK
jgi:hypothetical protein